MDHDWKAMSHVGTEARRARLRADLVEIASRRIASGGARSLRARALVAEAGCAVGTLYNVFPDMAALVLEVNGRTFATLGMSVTAATAGAGKAGPAARLSMMAHAYFQFAVRQRHLWNALFDAPLPAGGLPRWYRRSMEGLLSQIAAPLAELHPDRSARQLRALTRALFYAVHGIVEGGIRGTGGALTTGQIEEMISLTVRQFAARR